MVLYKRAGAITKDTVLALEKDLEPVKETARSLTVLVVAHAHIDMNWMWGFPGDCVRDGGYL